MWGALSSTRLSHSKLLELADIVDGATVDENGRNADQAITVGGQVSYDIQIIFR